MRIGYRWLVVMGMLLVARRSFVSSAPTQYLEGASAGEGVQDEDVKELERLKPSKGKTLSMMKSHSAFFSNVNGQKEQHSHTKEEVVEMGGQRRARDAPSEGSGRQQSKAARSEHAEELSYLIAGLLSRFATTTPQEHVEKDGQVVARVSQDMDKSGDVPAHVKTSLDIPSRNIHKTIEQEAKEEQENKRMPINFPENNADPSYKQYSGLRYSPIDMAEYVFWTGDEKGVTQAIEEFLSTGLMSKDDAIGYLMDIKQNLDYLQTHYNSQQAKEKSEERMNSVGSELSEVRQQMQDSISKKSDVMENSPEPGPLSEDDYEELLEKLRLEDLLYNEYSLEEVIYQLAKLMFTQSLTIGSAEAQETLQKFTNFLEAEAVRGRISRNLEKKVLDVLIAALSDTLTDHPDLVNTARESLGLSVPANVQLMQQIVNHGKPEMQNLSKQQKPHRFQGSMGNLKKTLQNSGLQDKEKRST